MLQKRNCCYTKYSRILKQQNQMCMSSTRSEELIWRYVPWIMEKDQALAVRVRNTV